MGTEWEEGPEMARKHRGPRPSPEAGLWSRAKLLVLTPHFPFRTFVVKGAETGRRVGGGLEVREAFEGMMVRPVCVVCAAFCMLGVIRELGKAAMQTREGRRIDGSEASNRCQAACPLCGREGRPSAPAWRIILGLLREMCGQVIGCSGAGSGRDRR